MIFIDLTMVIHQSLRINVLENNVMILMIVNVLQPFFVVPLYKFLKPSFVTLFVFDIGYLGLLLLVYIFHETSSLDFDIIDISSLDAYIINYFV